VVKARHVLLNYEKKRKQSERVDHHTAGKGCFHDNDNLESLDVKQRQSKDIHQPPYRYLFFSELPQGTISIFFTRPQPSSSHIPSKENGPFNKLDGTYRPALTAAQVE